MAPGSHRADVFTHMPSASRPGPSSSPQANTVHNTRPLRKHYTCDYSFIVKATNQEQPNESYGMKPGRVPNTETLCLLPLEPGYITL